MIRVHITHQRAGVLVGNNDSYGHNRYSFICSGETNPLIISSKVGIDLKASPCMKIYFPDIV